MIKEKWGNIPMEYLSVKNVETDFHDQPSQLCVSEQAVK